jgi:hypothetical protein
MRPGDHRGRVLIPHGLGFFSVHNRLGREAWPGVVPETRAVLEFDHEPISTR